MTIPVTLDYPTYTLTLPSNGKEIQFRPFIEKERKILLMAAENNADDVEMLIVMKNILKACCLTKINIDELTTFDVEYFFLHLRSKSIGEKVKLNFRCDNIVDTKPCNTIMEIDVDITDTELDKPLLDGLIKLSPKLAVQMKYPTFGKMVEYSNNPKRESIYGLVALSIDYIANDSNMFHAKDYTFDELLEFIESLNTQQFEKLQEFIEEMPSLTKKVQHKCTKCGYNHEIILKGYRSFFL